MVWALAATSSIPSTAPFDARPHKTTSLPRAASGMGVKSTVNISMLTRPTVRVRMPFTNTGVPVGQMRG